jgi:hypothetical protein
MSQFKRTQLVHDQTKFKDRRGYDDEPPIENTIAAIVQ